MRHVATDKDQRNQQRPGDEVRRLLEQAREAQERWEQAAAEFADSLRLIGRLLQRGRLY